MHGKVAAKKLRKSHARDTLGDGKGARGYAPWNPCAFNVEKWVCERVVSGQLTHGYSAPSNRPSFVPATPPLAVFVCAAKQFGVWNGSGQWRPHSATFAVGIYTALSNKLLPFRTFWLLPFSPICAATAPTTLGQVIKWTCRLGVCYFNYI